MLTIHRDEDGRVVAGEGDVPDEVIWIDLVEPTEDERRFVETRAGIRVPTIEMLSEIEASSRVAMENGVLYLSTPLVAGLETPDPYLSPAGFVLRRDLLVTIRYAALPSFDAVAEQVRRDPSLASGVGVFTALLETVVDRSADALEHLGSELDKLSRTVFRADPSSVGRGERSTEGLRHTLAKIGSVGERVSQARDVLLGVGRIAIFVRDVAQAWTDPDLHARLGSVSNDVASLNEYEAHISGKVQFLLDATLGYITIQQNEIFKVLTIASVVGVPPTVLAGIWGMNFKAMPELDWHLGYPLAVAAIALSACLPLLWFRRRGWF